MEMTARDRAILFLLARGESTTTVARQLGMSREGVERQLVVLRGNLGDPALPELLHAPQELRATAVAVLPDLELAAFAPKRRERPSRAPTELLAGLAGLVEVAAAAFGTVVVVVLLLTLIADALR